MSTKIYKIKSKKGQIPGAAYMLFTDGLLNAVNWEFKRDLNNTEKYHTRAKFPFNETDLKGFSELFHIEELHAKTAHDKLKLFCMIYKAKRGTPYTPKKQEKANIKNVVVTQGLLETYFKNDGFPLNYSKSINDYIKHYNHIRDINKNGTPEKSRFPNEYNSAYEKKLESHELSDYWKHLRNLGWSKNDRGIWIAPGKL